MLILPIVENPIEIRVRVSCIGGHLCASISGRTRKRLNRDSTASAALQLGRYTWSLAFQAAFKELKKKLTTAPILTPTDESQHFQVFCDASLQGLGGVLMPGRSEE